MKDLCPVISENSNVILLLIDHWLFILQDQERRTPLHAAACVGDVHIMDLLIESGEWAVCITDTLMRMKNLDSCDSFTTTQTDTLSLSGHCRCIALVTSNKLVTHCG